VPWHEFLIDPDDIIWDMDVQTGEKVMLGEGRFGTVRKNESWLLPFRGVVVVSSFDCH
jgi:hypothetical protein